MGCRIRSIFVAILTALALAGCVSKHALPDLPAELGERGILVARFYVLGMQAIENANVTIDGRDIASSMRDGYVAVALEPGEHTLGRIRASGQLLSSNLVEERSPIRTVKGGSAPTYIYVPGYTVTYTTLAVDREFRIEPGKVTNLGLIVYVPVPDDPDRKRASVNNARDFRVFALDNTAEISTFLETNYPQLVKTLRSREVALAPGKYLESKNLPALRRAIAAHEVRGPNVVRSPGKSVVFGRAGTLVAVSEGKAGAAPVVEPLDTGTLADIVGGAWIQDAFTFLTSDAQLLRWDGKALARSPFPHRVQPVRLQALGEAGLIAVDNHMNIMTAETPNGEWRRFAGGATPEARVDVRVVRDRKGAYVVLGTRGMPDAIYFVAESGDPPVKIPVPENLAGILPGDNTSLIVRDQGVFIVSSKPSFYFWSKATRQWTLQSQPSGKCKAMKFSRESAEIIVSCDGTDYRSDDNGATWAKPQA